MKKHMDQDLLNNGNHDLEGCIMDDMMKRDDFFTPKYIVELLCRVVTSGEEKDG